MKKYLVVTSLRKLHEETDLDTAINVARTAVDEEGETAHVYEQYCKVAVIKSVKVIKDDIVINNQEVRKALES